MFLTLRNGTDLDETFFSESHLCIILDFPNQAIWLVGCFGLNGPLRQYFSLYRAVSQREGDRKGK